MKKILIAFDIDGTLRNNTVSQDRAPVANEDIRTLLIILRKFKNTRIMVWSGGGELYARQVCAALGLEYYVDYYASKYLAEDDEMGVRKGHPYLQPDIVIDDIQDCVLGKINLICKEK